MLLQKYLYDKEKDLGIDFILDKTYPNSSLRYDFYLPELDMYIEIAGMMNIKEYNEKMLRKNKYFNAVIITPDEIYLYKDILKNKIRKNSEKD